MSKIRNSAFAFAATMAVGAGTMAGTAPAQAASVCNGPANVHCSIQFAKQIPATLSPGSRGTHVRQLQQALREVGFPVKLTGVYDAQTTKQVKRYQATRLISTTGVAGPQTRHALRVGAGVQRRSAKHRSVTSSVSVASASSSRAQAAVNFAYAQLGKPYVYGATGPNAYDCSGLTSSAWRSAGVSIPRTSGAQWSGLRSVSVSSLKAGDLVIFYGGGHVGIYVGNGYVIHAPHTGSIVKRVSLRSMPISGAVRPA